MGSFRELCETLATAGHSSKTSQGIRGLPAVGFNVRAEDPTCKFGDWDSACMTPIGVPYYLFTMQPVIRQHLQ